MLTSDKLILVELHKAGSARLKKLLGELVSGESSGKQTSYADELAASGKPVVGYLCNPLTWYLDLWKQGCAGKGDVRKRLTSDIRWGQLNARLKNREPKEGVKGDGKQLPEGWGPERAKDYWYADVENVEAFREWLKAVVAERGMRKLVDHGFGSSPMCRVAGLMSYHFFNLFVRGAENMDKAVNTMEALKDLYAKQGITEHFIRAESVSADVHKVLAEVGVKLDAEQHALVDALKERSGAADAAILRFYDVPSLRLVARRESFLNDLFGYGPPSAEARAASRAAAEPSADKPGEGAKLSKEEKEQRRQARSERQAAKAVKAAARSDSPAKESSAGGQAPGIKGKAAQSAKAKPEKVKRTKGRSAGDAADSEE
jgi:hypothetical protein